MSSAVPWPGDQVARVVLQNALAGVAVVAGAYQASIAEDLVRTRASWLAVAIAGLVLSGLANATWLLHCWQRVRTTEADAVSELRAVRSSRRPAVLSSPGRGRLSGPGMTRFHRAGCPLIAARPTTSVSPSQARRRSLIPCEVCEA